MYNPFPLLNRRLLNDKITQGKRYFVRQSYPRGHERGLQACFLFRAYDENEEKQAVEHYQSVQEDKNAFLYDITIPAHLEKLMIAAGQPSGYKIYYAGKTKVDWIPPEKYQFKMRKYIKKNHPGWRTTKKGTKIEIWLYEEFGHLFLTFNFDGEEDKIPFDQIETY